MTKKLNSQALKISPDDLGVPYSVMFSHYTVLNKEYVGLLSAIRCASDRKSKGQELESLTDFTIFVEIDLEIMSVANFLTFKAVVSSSESMCT